MERLAFLEQKSKRFWLLVGSGLVIIIFLLDYWTGYEVSFSLFYLAPIALVTWFAGRRVGLLISTTSAVAWLSAEIVGQHILSHPTIYFWNTSIRFGFFIIVTLLLARLRIALHQEQVLSRTDYLTGVANSRYFHTVLELEIARAHRSNHPITLAYIDLDNFKQANDHFGHKTGDQILALVSRSMQQAVRNIDTVGRLGGDEFAIIFPETDQEQARSVVSRLRLKLMEDIQPYQWPITFSIGVLTCRSDQCTGDELITRADNLMYASKQAGKNTIHFGQNTLENEDANVESRG
jgi:diguanylate cyclase (GGDEF)-like protein